MSTAKFEKHIFSNKKHEANFLYVKIEQPSLSFKKSQYKTWFSSMASGTLVCQALCAQGTGFQLQTTSDFLISCSKHAIDATASKLNL